MCEDVEDDTSSSEASSSSLSSDAPEAGDEATRHVFDVEDPTHRYIGRRHVDRHDRLFSNSAWSNPSDFVIVTAEMNASHAIPPTSTRRTT